MKTSIGAAICACLGMTSLAMAQDLPETTIKVIGNLSSSTQSKKVETPFWTGGIQDASGGQVTAEFRSWDQLGLKGPEVFGLLSKGGAHVATAQLGHHSGSDPINDGNDLAGMSASFDDFAAASEAFFPVLSDYYADKLGLHLISLQSYQSQVVYCREAFSGLADLKGHRVRTSGASQADFINYIGGVAINVPFGDVQQSLEQGVIDCAITSTVGGYTSRWYEGADYIYALPINFGAGATAANLEWWNAQPDSVRTFLTDELEALSDAMWVQNREEDAMGIACNTSGPCDLGEPAGMTLVDFTEADVALRNEAFVAAVLPGWIERCGEVCEGAYDDALASVTGLARQ